MKLQPGDYLSTKGMSEEDYHNVCNAFIEAGATEEEYYEFSTNNALIWDYVGWCDVTSFSEFNSNGIVHFNESDKNDYFNRKRLLTIKQVIGEEE